MRNPPPDAVSSSAANAALGTIMGHIATLIKTEMTLFALLVFISLSSSFPFSSIPTVAINPFPPLRHLAGSDLPDGERLCRRLQRITAMPMRNRADMANHVFASEWRRAASSLKSARIASGKEKRVPPLCRRYPFADIVRTRTQYAGDKAGSFTLPRNKKLNRFRLTHGVAPDPKSRTQNESGVS